MRSKVGIFALTIMSAACGPGRISLTASELPEDTDWVALLAQSESSLFADSTGLIEWQPPIELELDAQAADRFWLYAFRASDLDGLEPPAAEQLRASPIRRAKATDPLLTASWVGTGVKVEDVFALDATLDAPEITASWLPACPQLLADGEPAYADLRCPPPCQGTARQDGCRLTMDLGTCGYPNISGLIDGRGRIETDAAVLGRCEALPVDGPFAAALTCTGEIAGTDQCRIELHPPESGTPFLVESRRLHEGPLLRSSARWLAGRVGYLFGLAVLGDSVAIGGNRGTLAGYECKEPDTTRGEVLFLDPESLQTVRTTTLAECLTAMGHHPEAGVVAAIGPPSAQTLVHITESGEIRATLRLPPGIGDSDTAAVDIAASQDKIGVLVEHVRELEAPFTEAAYLLIYDADLLGPPLISEPLSRFADRLVAEDDGFAVLDRDSDIVSFIGVDAITDREVGLSTQCDLGAFRTWWLSHEQGLGSFVGIAQQDSGAMLRLGPAPASNCDWGSYFERPAIPYASVRPSETSAEIVVAVTLGIEETDTLLTRFDPEQARFMQPSQRIGEGVVPEAARDGLGRMWFIIPQDDRVVRAQLVE